MDKDKFSVHRMGQIYYRYNSNIPLVLFDKYNKFQAFQLNDTSKKFCKLPVTGEKELIESIPKQYESVFINGKQNDSSFLIAGGISSRSSETRTSARAFIYSGRLGEIKEVMYMITSRKQF